MATDLFNLFDEKLQKESSLVASSPQTLDSLSDDSSEQEFLIKKAKSFEEVEFKVDYSDFSNFVFFNSAEDYFNISGERILNEYPYDGTRETIQDFENESDGYQKYLVSIWPKNTGHLRFVKSSGSFIKFSDIGRDEGTSKSSLLSPGTGSLTLETWFRSDQSSYTSEEVRFLFQKISPDGNGYSLYSSGSNIFFRVVSGSSINEVSAPLNGDVDTYIAGVIDRSLTTGSIIIYTGSLTSYPVLVSSSSLTFVSALDIGSSSFFIGSGTLSTKETAFLTGNLGETRVWKKARQINELKATFNTRMFAEKNLIGLWTFSETGSLPQGQKQLVYDKSGKHLDGTIQNYYDAIRGSGSIVFSYPELVLNIDEPAVRSMVIEKQLSGSVFDKANSQLITRLFPENFFIEESEEGTFLFTKFLYVVARMFDQVKTSVKQFANIYKTNYSPYDQAPDALLADVAKFYGWDFVGNFISADAMKWLIGRGVLENLDANFDLDTKLYEIKNELWRRCINNLMYIYKTKGTRESIRALLHSYGVNDNLFRIKEYVLDNRVGLTTNRISAQKSVYSTQFGSASLTASVYRNILDGDVGKYLSSDNGGFGTAKSPTFEMHVRFPTTGTVAMPATTLTGTLWTLHLSRSGDVATNISLCYARDSLSSKTGSLILSGSNPYGVVAQLTGAGIFDDKWYHVAVRDIIPSGTTEIIVSNYEDEVIYSTSSYTSTFNFYETGLTTSIGSVIVGSPKPVHWSVYDEDWRFAEFWAKEFKVWSIALSDEEIRDHSRNFQSYGVNRVRNDGRTLVDHWRLDFGSTASIAPENGNQWTQENLDDNIRNPIKTFITGTNFAPSIAVSKRFLEDYDFIASPDMGWTDDKIRIVDGARQRNNEVVKDSSVIALELNMVDALNEDISQMMSSMDELNSILGTGASRFQDDYVGLAGLRSHYFKRLQGRLNFRVFADMLEFFDRSFIQMVRRLVPARATFIGDEFVVESHMLERPKVAYRRFHGQEKAIDIVGTITMVGERAIRFTPSTNDVNFTQRPSEDASQVSGIALHIQRISIPNSVKG